MKMITQRCLLGWLLLLQSLWAAAAPAPALDANIADAVSAARAAIAEQRLILLGEFHGTHETPLFTGALVDTLSADGSVVLALEISRSEQESLDAFLESDGGPDALARLSAARWWSIKGTQHDLRRSRDMFELIQRLRDLRASGRQVSVLAIDMAYDVKHDHHQRDREMAAWLREKFVTSDAAHMLVLVGNVHAMLAKPQRAPAQMQLPMGSYLSDLDPYSIRILGHSGAFWGCAPDCRRVSLTETQTQTGPDSGPEYQFNIVLPRLSVARFLDAD